MSIRRLKSMVGAHLFSVLLVTSIVTSISFSGCASYQEYVAESIEKEAENRVKKNTDKAINSGFDKAESGIKDAAECAVGDSKCIDKAKENGKTVVVKDESGEVVEQIPAEEGATAQTMDDVNANYDFKRGERKLFAADFSDAVVGNFPRNLEFRGGTISVVSHAGGRALRVKTTGGFAIHLPEELPKQFTIEFKDFNTKYVNALGVKVVDDDYKPVGTHFIMVDGYDGVGVKAYERGGVSAIEETRIINEQMMPIRIMADGSYVKVFVGKNRVANMPNADLGQSNIILFDFNDVRETPIYVADIHIAAGGRDLYGTLQSEGSVTMQGIHFATGSDHINSESAQAIQKVADLLQEHSDLNLLIEGHTSSSGDYDANMKLSKERAAAVKAYLVEKHGIAADRLETNGLGETEPKATNDTEEGRAKNRRVEIVKL